MKSEAGSCILFPGQPGQAAPFKARPSCSGGGSKPGLCSGGTFAGGASASLRALRGREPFVCLSVCPRTARELLFAQRRHRKISGRARRAQPSPSAGSPGGRATLEAGSAPSSNAPLRCVQAQRDPPRLRILAAPRSGAPRSRRAEPARARRNPPAAHAQTAGTAS